jgi:hypothetical protein
VDGEEFMARVKVWGRDAGTGAITAGMRISPALRVGEEEDDNQGKGASA